MSDRTPWDGERFEKVRPLFDRAQYIEELCDSGHFGEGPNYAPADAAWNVAFKAAERIYGTRGLETLVAVARQYGLHTAASRCWRASPTTTRRSRAYVDDRGF